MALPETRAEPPEVVTPQGIRFREMDWFLEHFHELAEAYPNRWLAIRDQKVMAQAATPRELAEQVRAQRIDRPFIASTNPGAWASYK